MSRQEVTTDYFSGTTVTRYDVPLHTMTEVWSHTVTMYIEQNFLTGENMQWKSASDWTSG
jgi:hypothetical protein